MQRNYWNYGESAELASRHTSKQNFRDVDVAEIFSL